MPIYEYECKKCKAHMEVLQKMTDKPLTKCRRCGGRLEKQWSATGFQFVGSGWYVTDYAGKKSEGGEEKKGSASAAAKESAAKESTTSGGDKSASKESKSTAEAQTSSGDKKTASSSKTSGD
ncbi:MAG TPA: FmdB family zinc ribbon protein [Pyrinomonadaceae bacterium]